MSKGVNQRLKLSILQKILLEKTDETHFLSMSEIIEELEKYDISSERKSLYSDIEALEVLGTKAVLEKGKGYHIVSRPFDVAELKLLVDAIQSSKFITESKTNELIKKLEALVSEHEAKQLHRQVTVRGRVKTMNEEIFNGVDIIHSAIGNNHRICFQYFMLNEKKEMVLRHNGKVYDVSPWALTWDDENYYLVAYDTDEEKIKHFRVDKMVNLSETSEGRLGKELFNRFNLADFAKKSFGMFGGDETDVQISFDNSMAGVIIDRFGKDVMIRPDLSNPGKSVVWVRVAVSNMFFGWIFSLGEGVNITKPDYIVEKAKKEIERLVKQYKMNDN